MSVSLATTRREFARALPRLVSAYESGRLVPFVGSGMSMGACTGWPEMIRRLEMRAFEDRPARPTAKATPSELIERANSVVRALKAGTPGTFEQAMRRAVIAQPNRIPKPTRTLARIWWPLVLTTNYDNCYLAAFVQRFRGELYGIVGRSPEDCQRVLTSLSNPGRPLLWALQGHMNVPCRIDGDALRPDLERELVVGHDEYRRVTYRDPLFRRAFAEVFRQRSLFFLGAGIKESYLQELFGEVLEMYGPSARPHYAIMPEGEVDPAFMLARFQIRVLEFPKGEYGEVDGFLERLVETVQAKTRRPFAWSFGGVLPGSRNRWYGSAELEIERTFLPARLRERECAAFPAVDGPGGFKFTPGLALRRAAWGVPKSARPRAVAAHVHEFVGARVFVMSMAANAGARSLTAVYDAALALFRVAGRRFDTIHMQLIATRTTGAASGAGPGFPARFVLIQTVRAFRDWRARNPTSRCKLVLHALAESVTMEIAAGRLDILELLSCEDVRFSAEIIRDDRTVERRVFELRPHATRLDAVVEQLDLSPRQWAVEVSPRPSVHRDYRPERPVANCLEATLHELGVVPGSTLHFRRGRLTPKRTR
jgi:SIR2-like protein